ncbi:hypothetical protein VTJ83DRAFT_5365 [Remersonia thermophila]|uniref:Uncharacterized protein n=1 Tax=Remersonia thermophila TaxID=72144 RepID=A0ABR4D6M7_9PEZI
MTSTSDFIRLTSGNILLNGLWIIPLTILWVISLCAAHQKRDAARAGIAWLKAAYPFFILSLLLWTICSGLNLWSWIDHSVFSTGAGERLYRAINHMNGVGELLNNVGDILLFVALYEFTRGLMIGFTGNAQQNYAWKAGRMAILAWGFTLLAISVACFGVAQNFSSTSQLWYTSDDPDFARARDQRLLITRLYISLEILLWLTATPITILVSVVYYRRIKGNLALKKLGSLLLDAAILNAIRHGVCTSIDIRYHLSDSSTTTNTNTDVPLIVTLIVKPLFDNLFIFIVLVLLFALVMRKPYGLSSSQAQPEWDQPSVAYAPLHPPQQPAYAAPPAYLEHAPPSPPPPQQHLLQHQEQK